MGKNIIIIIAAILLTLTGYYFWNNNQNRQTKKQETIKIGAVLPLTGNIAFLGKSAERGLKFAEYYISHKSNLEFKFVLEDGQGNPTKSINAFNKLIEVDKVNIVFSTISSVDLSLIPQQIKNGILFISHATHPELSNVNNLFFRHSPTVQQEAVLIFQYIGDSTKIAITYMNDEYGVGFESEMNRNFKSNIIASVPFQKEEVNFSTISQKLVNTSPSKIVICGAGQNLSSLPKKLRELGYEGEIIATLAYAVSGAIKTSDGINNLTMVNFEKLSPNSEFEKLLNEFENHNKIKLGTADFIFFNSALIVFNSLGKGKEPKNIADEIKSKANFDVLGGEISVNSMNDILPRLTFLKQ